MLVSVIMSVYNSARYMKYAIESILNQSYKDIEFLIMDDDSLDGSVSILKQYEKKDSRIRVMENKINYGLTVSLNTLIRNTKGELIARMDADDISKEKRLEKQIQLFKTDENLDIAGTFAEDIDKDFNVIRHRKVPVEDSDIKRMLPLMNPLNHPSVMFRKSIISRIGYYNERFRTTQDYDLWFRAAAAGLKFHNLPEYLLQYRVDDNYMKKKAWKYRWTEYRIRISGYKKIKLPIYKWVYGFIPIILGVIPENLFTLLKKLDPRNKFLH
ncbi:MAG: glycosyltransferase [Spirochaetales bacterium]|nr:glycosyltransferase [Spirochaetales bacterium]